MRLVRYGDRRGLTDAPLQPAHAERCHRHRPTAVRRPAGARGTTIPRRIAGPVISSILQGGAVLVSGRRRRSRVATSGRGARRARRRPPSRVARCRSPAWATRSGPCPPNQSLPGSMRVIPSVSSITECSSMPAGEARIERSVSRSGRRAGGQELVEGFVDRRDRVILARRLARYGRASRLGLARSAEGRIAWGAGPVRCACGWVGAAGGVRASVGVVVWRHPGGVGLPGTRRARGSAGEQRSARSAR